MTFDAWTIVKRLPISDELSLDSSFVRRDVHAVGNLTGHGTGKFQSYVVICGYNVVEHFETERGSFGPKIQHHNPVTSTTCGKLTQICGKMLESLMESHFQIIRRFICRFAIITVYGILVPSFHSTYNLEIEKMKNLTVAILTGLFTISIAGASIAATVKHDRFERRSGMWVGALYNSAQTAWTVHYADVWGTPSRRLCDIHQDETAEVVERTVIRGRTLVRVRMTSGESRGCDGWTRDSIIRETQPE